MCQQNFALIKLYKGKELSPYTIQRDNFKQELLNKQSVIWSSDSFCRSKHCPDPQKHLVGKVFYTKVRTH